MDSLITAAARAAAARALAAGDALGALNRVALRDDGFRARASRYRDGAAWRPRSSEGSRAKSGERLWSERGRGPREMCRCRGGDRARFARPGLASESARRSAGDAREHGDRVNAAYARYLQV